MTKGCKEHETKDQILNYLHDCHSQNVNAVVTLSQIGAHLRIKRTIIKPILREIKKMNL
jgi:DNA-binding MarR family transcriptional regulator